MLSASAGFITKSPTVTATAGEPIDATSITLLIEEAAVVVVNTKTESVNPGVSITKSSGKPEPKTLSPALIVDVSPAIAS